MIDSRRVIPCMREWAEKAFASVWAKEPAAKTERPKKIPLVWTEATDDEKMAIQALSHTRFVVGSWDKRFARKIQGSTKLTEGQREQLWRIVARYHRQIPHDFVRLAKQFTGRNQTNGKPTDQH